MAFPFGDRPPQRADLLADRPVLVKPVLGIPHRQFAVRGRHVGWMGGGDPHCRRKITHRQPEPQARPRVMSAPPFLINKIFTYGAVIQGKTRMVDEFRRGSWEMASLSQGR